MGAGSAGQQGGEESGRESSAEVGTAEEGCPADVLLPGTLCVVAFL